MTDTTKSEEQRAQVWSAVQTLLGWAGLIALCAGGYYVVGLLPGSVPPGPEEITFIEHKIANDSLFWMALVGVIFFFLFLGTVKTTLGLVLVCAVFLAGGGSVVWNLYSRVAAIAFPSNSVELRYVWPKPAERLSPREIISANYEESVRLSDDYLLEYALHLRTQRGDYVSFNNPSLDHMQQALQRIKEIQGRSVEY